MLNCYYKSVWSQGRKPGCVLGVLGGRVGQMKYIQGCGHERIHFGQEGSSYNQGRDSELGEKEEVAKESRFRPIWEGVFSEVNVSQDP